MIRVLHTSDWHLGCGLKDQRRDDEFQAFLNWLLTVIQEHEINVVVISGDIFDTYTPSNEARRMYYSFLASAITLPSCWHIVITAGNHDSSTFIDAPVEILGALKISVIGAARDPQNEVFPVCSPDGQVRLIVCAVPFLRDADVRKTLAGEDASEVERAYQTGVARHYTAAAEAAERYRSQFGPDIPVLAMGHLYATGCEYFDGDEHKIVGNLNGVPPETFPNTFDYVALGHIHIPQTIAGRDHIRYCGSPFQLQFNEAHSKKLCCLVEFNNRAPSVSEIAVPVFHQLAVVEGDVPTIKKRLQELIHSNTPTYVQVRYTGQDIVLNLPQTVSEMTKDTPVTVLATVNPPLIQRYLSGSSVQAQDLNDLTPEFVFKRLMTMHNVPDEKQRIMLEAYKEVINSLETGSALTMNRNAR